VTDRTQQIDQLIDTLKVLGRTARIYGYTPYGHPDTFEIPDWTKKPWQLDFHNAGATNKERMLACANGVGKSICGAAEIAIHALGDYPDWWEGWRFEKAPSIWIGSISNELQRSSTQGLLLGPDLEAGLGTGFIPKDRLAMKPRTRQAAISGVCDNFTVLHASGEYSHIQYKTYEQGWRKWQAAAPNIVWLDEEPDENEVNQRPIFSEVQTRLVRSGGILLVTYTPLLGMTQLTRHFMEPKSPGIWYMGATWEDAPHLEEEDKKRLRATYPAHESEARTMGLPMMGEGRIFVTPEEEILVPDRREIPPYWARIKGLDFSHGGDHPLAHVELAHDRDADVIYLIRCWRRARTDIEEHAAAVNEFDPWVPVAWPHDGHRREGSNKIAAARLKDHYRDCGVRMLSKSARYKNDEGGPQPVWPIIERLQAREQNGGFKVFASAREYLEERRNYHTKEGKVVAVRDDLLKACFYALMMLRYAVSHSGRRHAAQTAPRAPVFTTRI